MSPFRHLFKSTFVAAALSATLMVANENESGLHQPYAELLSVYAKAEGIDYATWFQSPNDRYKLSKYISALGETYPKTSGYEDRKAILINLYNAAMIETVFQYYPINSVTEIMPDFGIFRKKHIQLGDDIVSLDDIEKGILLKEYPDPRIHFAVNCASISCPPLRQEPYYGERLNEQLEEQTLFFAGWIEGLQIREDRVLLSSLLDWYAHDFEDNDPIGFLNQYRESAIPRDRPIEYIPYNWDLNRE
ncbi:MAG: DUF547 domain-containing protein [Opitutales bacterium]|nr:DUF547 domain-containing protein [Opitutales bacterium]NRA26653.1 DUF547 domain-containing protein [Opitutales bacterium]